jgi:hypothetical protein
VDGGEQLATLRVIPVMQDALQQIGVGRRDLCSAKMGVTRISV